MVSTDTVEMMGDWAGKTIMLAIYVGAAGSSNLIENRVTEWAAGEVALISDRCRNAMQDRQIFMTKFAALVIRRAAEIIEPALEIPNVTVPDQRHSLEFDRLEEIQDEAENL